VVARGEGAVQREEFREDGFEGGAGFHRFVGGKRGLEFKIKNQYNASVKVVRLLPSREK
jgi:hypothetical protein